MKKITEAAGVTHATCILKAQRALFAVHEIIAFGPPAAARVQYFRSVGTNCKIFANDKAPELKNKARNGCEVPEQKMNGKKFNCQKNK